MSYIIPNNISITSATASNHVSASYFFGDGSNLTNLPSTGGPVNIQTSGNISGSGTILNPVGLKDNISLTSVTASVLSASDVITNYINFNNSSDPAWENGRVWYNNTTHELDYWTEVNGFNVKLGQQLVQRCQNDAGVLLAKGTVVHITGSTSSDTPRIVLADWTNDNMSANTLGLVAENIAIGGTGYVIVQGILKDVNTNSYNPGAMLFLSSSGQITDVKPSAPKHLVSLGQVVRKQINSGSIYVSIQNGYEIGELHDVLTNGKSNGDLLVWDSSIPAWRNSKALSGSYQFNNSLTASNISASSGIYGRLYGTSSYSLDADKLDGQDSGLFALKTDVTGAIASFPVRLEVSGAITGALGSYAKSTDVSSSFTTPLQVSGAISNFSTRTEVSGAITGALGTYAKSTDVTSSFGLKTDLTASYARLASANSFTDNQIITGSLILNSVSGVIVNSGTGSMITKDVDRFTSGVRNGVGRWGLFYQEDSLITGIPNSGTKYFSVSRWNADSTRENLIYIDSVSGNLNCTGSVLPFVNNTNNIGDSTKYWNKVYAYEIVGINKVSAVDRVSVGVGGLIGDVWSWQVDPALNTNFNLFQDGIKLGYFVNNSNVNIIDFTGQHRSQHNIDIYNIQDNIGLIVSSTGEYSQNLLSAQSSSIQINEAIPKVDLANSRNDKKVFGVISDIEDTNSSTREYSTGNFVSIYEKDENDNRIFINSLGEGAIWVCNINGNLENGDYITSCEVPGYGMKQDDDLLHNYTVAKITCDCDFNLNSSVYRCEEFQHNGNTYRRAFVGCTYHCG